MAGGFFDFGQSVRLIGGAFDGFCGTVITAEEAAALPNSVVPQEVDEQSAIWVAVDIFGRKVAIKHPPDRLANA
jgi:hypothetical protein